MSEYHAGSFTEGYEEFWRRSNAEIDKAIESHQIVLDTNAVLHLYRMNASARGEYFQVLEKVAKRIWIPRQVADEFHRNRLSSVDAHIRALREKSRAAMEAADALKDSLRDFARLHSLAGGANAYVSPFNQSIDKIKRAVQGDVDAFDLSPGRLVSDDPILKRLAVLFDNRVGAGIPAVRREEVQREAERRGEEKIPPGYKDVDRKGTEGYGDYFIWQEMLEQAKATRIPILFVSTDVKEDWVRTQCGLTVGPRPELVEEMHRVAEVNYFHVTLAGFLARAAGVLNVPVSEDTINQVKHRSDSRERLKRDISKLTATLAKLSDQSVATHRIISKTDQREQMLSARLAAAEEAISKVDHSSPEGARLSEELNHLRQARNEAISMRHLTLQTLQSLENQRGATLDRLKLLEVTLEA